MGIYFESLWSALLVCSSDYILNWLRLTHRVSPYRGQKKYFFHEGKVAEEDMIQEKVSLYKPQRTVGRKRDSEAEMRGSRQMCELTTGKGFWREKGTGYGRTALRVESCYGRFARTLWDPKDLDADSRTEGLPWSQLVWMIWVRG